MPPLVLISSTAISVPPFIHTPYEAPEPVSGRMAPILIGCCCARAAGAVIRATERKAARRFSIAGSSPARDADSGRNGNLVEAIQSVGRSQLPRLRLLHCAAAPPYNLVGAQQDRLGDVRPRALAVFRLTIGS